MSYDQYGRPIVPPPHGFPPMMMGGGGGGMMMMMMPPPVQHHMMPPPPPLVRQQEQQQQRQDAGLAGKRTRPSTENDDDDPSHNENDGERRSYPVKKYRPDSYYRSIEAFARYTKSHRMLDASYDRWNGGGSTSDKPHVYGIKIAGSYLSWGRGRTRDAAIDASIRAAFALVAAHGYDDFALTEDCFTEEPYDVPVMAPMPPPPPPPPPGYGMMPPLPPGVPPPGMPPNFGGGGGGGGAGPMPPSSSMMPPPMGGFGVPPPHHPDAEAMMIPQPMAPSANLAIASSGVILDGDGGTASMLGLGLSGGGGGNRPAAAIVPEGGSTSASRGLVYAGTSVDENGDEMSMEEMRMRIPRYWNSIVRGH